MYWHWAKGFPCLMTKAEMSHIPQVTLVDSLDNQICINQKEVTESHKTLGILMCPTGSEQAQFDYLQKQIRQICGNDLASRLTEVESHWAYHSIRVPSLTYSLGTTALSEIQLLQIQSLSTSTFLKKMGFNKHVPRSATYAPKEYGGLNFRSLPVKQGLPDQGSHEAHLQ